MITATVQEMEKAALDIRIDLLRLCNKEVIHIGGDLSITDVMTALWQFQMQYDPQNITDESRDRFVLSKGHASAVTSFNQAAIGCFSPEDVIREYATDQGRFSMHSSTWSTLMWRFPPEALDTGCPLPAAWLRGSA